VIVAIDGPAGSGKSSVSREVARRTGTLYLNSGRFYRAITWKALSTGITETDTDRLVDTARHIRIEVTREAFLVDGIERTDELHTGSIDRATAIVSRIPEVRHQVNRRLKEIAENRSVVVEGRDMSTVVFPEADVKIYIDADVHARALRRRTEWGDHVPIEDVERAIRERDEIDKTKEHGALVRPEDAVYLDTTHLTLDQVCERVIAIIQKKTNQNQEHQRSHGR